jgi:hypothetical protein
MYIYVCINSEKCARRAAHEMTRRKRAWNRALDHRGSGLAGAKSKRSQTAPNTRKKRNLH